MKRKANNGDAANGRAEKRAATDKSVEEHFREGLFDDGVLKQYTSEYAASQPYDYCIAL